MNQALQTAIFPGSFDPLTLGHIDIVTRALKIFDKVLIAVLNNPGKQTLFSVEERVNLIVDHFDGVDSNDIASDIASRVQVKSFSGLLVDFAAENKAKVIIRGLRATSDFDYEAQMALMNRSLTEDIETFFLTTRAEYSYVSSSLVKQVAPFGGDVSGLVPEVVSKALKIKMS